MTDGAAAEAEPVGTLTLSAEFYHLNLFRIFVPVKIIPLQTSVDVCKHGNVFFGQGCKE